MSWVLLSVCEVPCTIFDHALSFWHTQRSAGMGTKNQQDGWILADDRLMIDRMRVSISAWLHGYGD